MTIKPTYSVTDLVDYKMEEQLYFDTLRTNSPMNYLVIFEFRHWILPLGVPLYKPTMPQGSNAYMQQYGELK